MGMGMEEYNGTGTGGGAVHVMVWKEGSSTWRQVVQVWHEKRWANGGHEKNGEGGMNAQRGRQVRQGARRGANEEPYRRNMEEIE